MPNDIFDFARAHSATMLCDPISVGEEGDEHITAHPDDQRVIATLPVDAVFTEAAAYGGRFTLGPVVYQNDEEWMREYRRDLQRLRDENECLIADCERELERTAR